MQIIRSIVAAVLLFKSVHTLAGLNVPDGFKQPPLLPNKSTDVTCPDVPPPYTGDLLFTSKYEGADNSRSVINPDALSDYLDQTNTINDFQQLLADLSNKYMRTGNVGFRRCALSTLTVWAKAGALLSKSTTHTGVAVRKWTLAAIGAAYAKIIFSGAENPGLSVRERREIEKWLVEVTELVFEDYDGLPLDKINNHDYWAAWAIGITAVSLNRADLLQWSYEKYVQAMGQVDIKTGYLPNELKRKSLALSYHHYAVQPLVSLAVLLKTNGYEVFKHNNSALERLVSATLRATVRPQLMAEAAEENQKTDKLVSGSGLSWLEPWLVLKPDAIIPFRWQQLRPMTSSRLGGDLTLIYAEKYVEKSNSYLSHPQPPLINQINAWPYGRNIFDDKVFAYYRRNFNRTTPLI